MFRRIWILVPVKGKARQTARCTTYARFGAVGRVSAKVVLQHVPVQRRLEAI
jgi:hypothetical protein